MKSAGRYVALCLACSAFAVIYTTAAYVRIPTLYYYPVERRWTFDHMPGIAMAWFGHTLAALLASCVAYALATLYYRRGPPSNRAGTVVTIVMVVAYAWALAVIAWTR